MKDTDLAWLAGIWDGEGTITVFSNTEKSGQKKIKPLCVVVNTDIQIISKIQEILLSLDCNFVITERKKEKKHHSLCWSISTGNMLYIDRLLTAISPYLFGIKRAKADIVLRYVKQRMSKTDVRRFNGTTPYDEKDWSYVQEFRSSETTREAA